MRFDSGSLLGRAVFVDVCIEHPADFFAGHHWVATFLLPSNVRIDLRARAMRDITVPMGTPIVCEIS
jgi:hypothetical protein